MFYYNRLYQLFLQTSPIIQKKEISLKLRLYTKSGGGIFPCPGFSIQPLFVSEYKNNVKLSESKKKSKQLDAA